MVDYLNSNLQGKSSSSGDTQVAPKKAAPVFSPPKFSVEHPINPRSTYEKFMHGLGHFLGSIGKVPIFCCFPNPYKRVEQGDVGLVTRYGEFYKAVDAGLVEINPISENLRSVNIMIQIAPIGNIPVVTKDNVNITIESVIYWHIIDPFAAIYGVSNVQSALIERAQTTLRAVAGSRVLQDLIENRETVASAIRELIEEPAADWGVRVESILIKDVKFSHELQNSLSAAAVQRRIGESKVIAAQAEVNSAKLMREAAEILNTPAAMQIRYLETLQAMSKNAGTKVMFIPLAENGPQSMAQLAPIMPGDKSAEGKGKAVDNGGDSNKNNYKSAINEGVKDAALFQQLSEME
ncbi:hypothetical protein H4219_004358 [Mycoemilia scoparia]|uniref:Band 7 domain-containing protein n=1 Tax=Mycoemilia scoparia TaxID=417184 RepID=A0A9W7ZSK3_9FUNG|nr:hypothetical protein H4219_004358 [Mycoemilia scoparia]